MAGRRKHHWQNKINHPLTIVNGERYPMRRDEVPVSAAELFEPGLRPSDFRCWHETDLADLADNARSARQSRPDGCALRGPSLDP
jgi:hypothetical protein